MTDATSARCIAVGSMDAIDEVVEMKWTSTADDSTDESASTQELDIERNESQHTPTRGRRRERGRAAQKPIDDSDKNVVIQRRRYILLALSVIPLLAATIALAAALKSGTETSSNVYATTDKIIVTAPKQQESDAPTHAPSALAQEGIAATTDGPSHHPTPMPTISQTASPVKEATHPPVNMSFLSNRFTNSPTLSNVPTSQPTELCVQIGLSCPKGGKDSLQCCNNGICVKNKDTGETVCAEDSKQSSGNKQQQQQQQANTCTDSGAECPKNPKECCSGKCSFVITTMKQEGGGQKQQGVGEKQGGGEKQQAAAQICE